MAKITLNIYWEDSNYDNSVITDKIDAIEGIETVTLNLLNRTWEIVYDINKITSDEILELFSKEWYSAQIVTNED